MTFPKPDENTIKRMTVESVSALISGLKARRDQAAAPFNEEIQYYEKILDQKKKEANA